MAHATLAGESVHEIRASEADPEPDEEILGDEGDGEGEITPDEQIKP